MNKNMFHPLLCATIAIITLAGCSEKTPQIPKAPITKKAPVVKQVPKEITSTVSLKPADLYLSSKAIKTKVGETKDINLYDLTVNVNNSYNASAYINLKNTGEKPLNISKIDFNDESKNLFALASACGTTIKAHSECKLKVTFLGKHKGQYTSNILIKSNSNGKYIGRIGKIHVIATAKENVTGTLKLVQNSTQKSKNNPMQELHFNRGRLSKVMEFKNTGIEDININDITLTGKDKTKFSIKQECPKILKVGQSCELKISYNRASSHMALSYLTINSDGVLYPSNRVRLTGESVVSKNAPEILRLADKDEMSITTTATIHPENLKQTFLEDYENVKPVYYFRTMYQNIVDPKFKEYYEEIITYYFSKNGYKVTTNAQKADKILNIYPKVTIAKSNKGAIRIVSNIRINVVTKASKKATDERIAFDMEVTVKNASDDYLAYTSASKQINSFMFNLLGLED